MGCLAESLWVLLRLDIGMKRVYNIFIGFLHRGNGIYREDVTKSHRCMQFVTTLSWITGRLA